MRFDVVTIFPELFDRFKTVGLLGKAVDRGLVDIEVHELRDFSTDPHRKVDDAPYGGGPGMVMSAEPMFAAVDSIRRRSPGPVALLSPQGRSLDAAWAAELAGHPSLILLCGRYEGVDERVREHVCDLEISIGDFVLLGGEVAAMVVIEVLCRFIPGVVGDPESVHLDSFSNGGLTWPQYTRPVEFRGWRVPEVLLSGNHEAVAAWRRDRAEQRTLSRRPDLARHRMTFGGPTDER